MTAPIPNSAVYRVDGRLINRACFFFALVWTSRECLLGTTVLLISTCGSAIAKSIFEPTIYHARYSAIDWNVIPGSSQGTTVCIALQFTRAKLNCAQRWWESERPRKNMLRRCYQYFRISSSLTTVSSWFTLRAIIIVFVAKLFANWIYSQTSRGKRQ